jgi:hypothetical protein
VESEDIELMVLKLPPEHKQVVLILVLVWDILIRQMQVLVAEVEQAVDIMAEELDNPEVITICLPEQEEVHLFQDTKVVLQLPIQTAILIILERPKVMEMSRY